MFPRLGINAKTLYAIKIHIIHFILCFPRLGNMHDDTKNEILADMRVF